MTNFHQESHSAWMKPPASTSHLAPVVH